ncbi:alpha/beta fold hydrolase [Leptospira interrogans]
MAMPSSTDPWGNDGMNETVQITHGRAWVDADNGVRLGYTDARTTEQPLRTVLLLHGAPQTRYFWRHVIEPLALAGYRVIAPDYRGAGESSKPLAGYDKWTMAGDIHTLVRETLGVKGPIAIVGHDLGSMLAFAYALRYRDEISTATFMEGPLPGTEYYKRRVVAKSAWHFRLPLTPRHRCVSNAGARALVHSKIFRRAHVPH